MIDRQTVAVAVVALVVGSVVGGAAVAGVGESPNEPGDGPDGPTDSMGDIAQFASEDAFRAYLARGQSGTVGSATAGQASRAGEAQRLDRASTTAGNGGNGANGGSSDTAVRSSSTNVQEQGIDEPDILKTTGSHVYYARRSDTRRSDYVQESGSAGRTFVYGTSDPASPQQVATINRSGRLLRTGDQLVVITDARLVGYDVSSPDQPRQVWSRRVNGTVETARLHDGTVYLVTRTRASPATPCPIRPLGGEGGAIQCTSIYHPREQIDVDATYSAYAVAPADGSIADSVSFVGTADASAVYMSGNALYVTYTERAGRLALIENALKDPAVDAPAYVVERIEEVRSYDLTTQAATTEVTAVAQRWLQSLPTERREATNEALQSAAERYLRQNRRNLTTTGIVRVDVGSGLSVAATGTVPGTPLDQFSMDERDGRLRITTTIPGRLDFDSANDLYVLSAESLDRVGAEQGMGLGQRVYATRYVGDTAYVVTFRRVDPLHVVDLSDPDDPTEVGTLELPGFSSYLHPIDDDHILGVGREDGDVKTVLFDVSDPTDPTIDDTYYPEADWSAIAQSHHAFLLDRRHGVFFLPGDDGGYVVDYTGGDLRETTRVETDGGATRAAYVGDYMYVFSDRGIVVVDETDWSVVERTTFGR